MSHRYAAAVVNMSTFEDCKTSTMKYIVATLYLIRLSFANVNNFAKKLKASHITEINISMHISTYYFFVLLQMYG